MTPVLALDLSATKAGVALPDGTLRTLVAPTKWFPRGCDEVGARLYWWYDEIGDLMHEAQPAVVAVEGYSSTPGRTGTMARIAEVTGLLRLHANGWHCLYHEVPPATLKKWACGSGRAGKDDMIAAARARGFDPANDDEADACLLRLYALEHVEVVA